MSMIKQTVTFSFIRIELLAEAVLDTFSILFQASAYW